MFYRDICNIQILSNLLKNKKAKDTVLSYFRQYNKSPQRDFSKEELIIFQKSDKGNSIVIVDMDTYIQRMENL